MTLMRNKYRFGGKHKNKSKSYIVQVLFSVTEILRIYFHFCLPAILSANETEGGRAYGEPWNGKNAGWDCRG